MRVLNKYRDSIPSDAIYVGRGSGKFSFLGNPWTHEKDKKTLAKYVVATREEAVAKYKEWLREEVSNGRIDLKPLIGHDLVCYCAPKRCHSNAIIEIMQEIGL